MSIFVLGATGATGQLVVEQLIKQQKSVKIIIRPNSTLAPHIAESHLVDITYANFLELSDDEIAQQLQSCHAVVSCLGHNMTFKGIFGQPRRLVTSAIERVCNAIINNKPKIPVKLILMSTTGYQNHLINEKVSLAHNAVISLIRLILPPHVDNELAAQWLQQKLTNHSQYIEWVGVRPDSLTDQLDVSSYDVHLSPTSDPIFESQSTSRINVAHFITELITNDRVWFTWKGQFPVIYNAVNP